jgi:hypothetical protein
MPRIDRLAHLVREHQAHEIHESLGVLPHLMGTQRLDQSLTMVSRAFSIIVAFVCEYCAQLAAAGG